MEDGKRKVGKKSQGLLWMVNISLRSKRFREAKSEEKAKNGGFGVLPRAKMGREQK